MKHAIGPVNFTRQADFNSDRLFVCLTHRSQRLIGLLLLLLLTTFLPSFAQPAIQWDRTLGGDSFDELSFLQQSNDGGYILGGTSFSSISGDKTEGNEGDSDYWVVKLDAAGNKQWDKTFGGTGLEWLNCLQQTLDGGYLLGGYSSSDIGGDKTSANKGDSDYWVVKLDAAGNKQWDKTYGGSLGDYLISLQQTRDGGYILGGSSRSDVSGDKTEDNKGSGDDYWVVKVDAAGNMVWDRTIGGDFWDILDWLQQTNEGGYILGGTSSSSISGDKSEASKGESDYWVVKLDAAGNKQWDRILGGTGPENLSSLQQTRDGGYILGGTSFSGISGNKTGSKKGGADYWVVKLDTAGNKVWDRTYGGSLEDELSLIQQTSDGGYILCGSSGSGISGDKTETNRGMCNENYPSICPVDYWIVKLDAVGYKVWDKTIGGSENDNPYALQQTADGGYILGGASVSGISGDKTQINRGECSPIWGCSADYWVVKLGPFTKAEQQVLGFTLINTETGRPIRELTDGDTIILADLPTQKLNIRADTSPERVGSVRFELSGQQNIIQLDNQVPYALFGDTTGSYNAWAPGMGSYSLRATPYAQPDGQGLIGTPHTIYFTLIRKQGGLPVPSVEWDRTLGGSGGEGLTFVQQTQDGGYIMGGNSESPISGDKTQAGKGDYDYWVVKLDAAGNKVWDKTYGGNKEDYLFALQQTSDGGYVLGGMSFSGMSGDKSEANRAEYPNAYLTDFWVVRLDAAGNKIWDKTFGGSENDDLMALQQTSDGGFILGGSSDSDISGDKTEDNKGRGYDYWVVKLDSTGTKVWDRTIGGDFFDNFGWLQQTRDKGYILGGDSYSSISGDKTEANKADSGYPDYSTTDYWVVKLDSAGNKQWDKTLGGTDMEDLSFLQQSSDGGYILGGNSNSGLDGDKTQDNKGEMDYWVVKLDAAGNKVWDKTIGGRGEDYLSSLHQTSDGGYIVGGSSKSPLSGDKTEDPKGKNPLDYDYDYWIVKLDAAGEIYWDKTIGAGLSDVLGSVQQTRDGGFILGGGSGSPISSDKSEASKGESDYWVVKLAPLVDGEQQVKSFTLINTESEEPIRTLQDGDTLDLASLPKKLNIRADTNLDTVGSVRFELSGQQSRTYQDHAAPYALFGDVRGDYEKWYPAPGSYTLTATPYSKPNGQGQAGRSLSIRFTVKLPQVASFTLINTQSEEPIRTLQDGDTLDLASLPKKLNIRADTNPATAGSVQFALRGQQARTYQDHAAPYALFGDVRGDYNKWYPAPGRYTLTATPYIDRSAKREAGTPLTIHFTVVRQQTAVVAARKEQGPQPGRTDLASRPTLFPNPTSDGRLKVQLQGDLQGQVHYRLLSSGGRKLADGSFYLMNTGNLLEFDFSRPLRASGVYYLRFEGNKVQQTFKIIRR